MIYNHYDSAQLKQQQQPPKKIRNIVDILFDSLARSKGEATTLFTLLSKNQTMTEQLR